jgi:TatD DNase family protein
MQLVDTHCHLAHGRLASQAPAVLDRAARAGVAAIVCASGTIAESRKSLQLAQGTPANSCALTLRFTAGVHPHEALPAVRSVGWLDELAELCSHPLCAAVGEVGLDYHYDHSPRESQREAFAAQLALAARLHKRVVIHTREALDDTLSVLRQSGVRGGQVIFHSFTEGPQGVRRVLDLGAMVSFSGIATFRNAAGVRESARLVPDDRLLIETDSPYLSPEPVRAMKTNEPANVLHVCANLAALRGVSPEHLAAVTTANAVALLGLDGLGAAGR